MFLSSRREITDNAQHPDPQHRVRCGHRDQLTHPDRIVCHQGGAGPRPELPDDRNARRARFALAGSQALEEDQ